MVHTSDLRGAGTDSNVHLVLKGADGMSEVFGLEDARQGNLFERGAWNKFTVQSRPLGPLRSLLIGHDGTGMSSGFGLSRTCVQDKS